MTRAARAASAWRLASLAQRRHTAHLSSRQPAERLRSSSTTAQATCWHSLVKGFVHHHNSIHNNCNLNTCDRTNEK